jgi:hypothetical protein
MPFASHIKYENEVILWGDMLSFFGIPRFKEEECNN